MMRHKLSRQSWMQVRRAIQPFHPRNPSRGSQDRTPECRNQKVSKFRGWAACRENALQREHSELVPARKQAHHCSGVCAETSYVWSLTSAKPSRLSEHELALKCG